LMLKKFQPMTTFSPIHQVERWADSGCDPDPP
jgi:hypothetical protein